MGSKAEKAEKAEKAKPAEKGGSKSLASMKCAYCKETGHHIANCVKLAAKKATEVGAEGDGNVSKETSKETNKEPGEKKQYPCAYCKETGHHIANCEKLAGKNKVRATLL